MINKKILSSCIFLILIIPSNVYGHGLGSDSTSIQLEGREIKVTIDIPQYYEETADKQIRISATDNEKKENVANVTFLIGLFHNNELVFRNYFFTDDGNLIINVNPSSEGETKIEGEKDDLLGAWYATESQPIVLSGPVFESGGLFHFEIELRTIDEPTNIIEELETYTADVSLVETTKHIQKDQNDIDTQFQVKSYYDSISSFEYIPEEEIKFEMPFDWSEKNTSHIPLIHEEVHFPKDFVEFLSPGYVGQVNGVELFKSSVVIDDYTEDDERIVHFILLQDHIRYLKNELKKQGDLPENMVFTLTPSEIAEFPMIAYTRDEQLRVDLSWEPIEIEPGVPTKFIFTIRDGATGDPLRNSEYDFVVLQGGSEIYRNSGNAQVGGGFEDFTFEEEQTGPTVIRFEDIRGTGNDTEFSLVVIPEFGIIASLVLIISMILMLTISKQRGLLKSFFIQN